MHTDSAVARWTAVGVITQGAVRPEGGVGYGGTIFATPLDAVDWPALAALLVEGVPLPLFNEALIREFAGEYLGSAMRHVPFGGRDAELADLSAWVREAACTTLLVTGAAGAGKSALLAHFAAALEETADVEVVYVPITVRFGMSAETTILRAVVARLGALQGETPACANVAEWRETLARYCAAPMEGRRTVVVVLDGLDEAAGWRPGRWLLPPRDVPRVKLLLAARSLESSAGGGWLEQLGSDARTVRPLALGPLDEEGIEHVLRSVNLLPANGAEARQVRLKLADLTRGDALVLALYVEDALERDGPLTVHALGAQPAGLDGYVERWWADQAELWGAALAKQEPVVRLVLNLLACALGPIPRRDLLGLAGLRITIDGDSLDDALTTLRRFVIRTPRGWAMSHPALAEHRKAKLEEGDELQAVHELFARWGIGLADGPGQIPPYVVYHLAPHMEAAGAQPEQFARFADDRWRLAWEYESDEPGGHLDDARRARKVMLDADRALVVIGQPPALLLKAFRCLWAIATGSEAVTDFPYGVAAQMLRHGLWTPRRALSFVRAQRSSDDRARALTLMAPYLDAEAALAGVESLMKALDESADYPDARFHAEGLGTLVVRLASLGHIRTARRLIAGVSGKVRAFADLELAVRSPDDLGLLASALRDIEALEGDVPYWLLDSLIERVSAERVEAALAVAQGTAPVAGTAVAWLTEQLPSDPSYDAIYDVARVASWRAPAARRRAMRDVLAACACTFGGDESWAVAHALSHIKVIAPHLDCDGLRTALALVESAQVGYRPIEEEVDLLLRLAECERGGERAQTEQRALEAIPEVLRIPGVRAGNELLRRLASLDQERVLDVLAAIPAEDWYAGEALAELAPELDPDATRRAMVMTAGVRWENRPAAVGALASRLAALGLVEAQEALSILSSGAAPEEQKAALVVLEACASGEAVAEADVRAISDRDLRVAVMIAASHAGLLSASALHAGVRSFGNDQRAIETFAALSGAALAWADETMLAALEGVTLHVPYEGKGAVLVPCFAQVARRAGKLATLEFAARLGGRLPTAAAWAVAGLARVHELSLGDLQVAGIADLYDEPLARALWLLYVQDDPEAAACAVPSELGAVVRANNWADVVGVLPARVREIAIGRIPGNFWEGPDYPSDTVWTAAALRFVPMLPRERIDMLRQVVDRVDSATDRAALGAAFAVRLADLGDTAEAYAEAQQITRGESFARAVAEMVTFLPSAELQTWLMMVLEHFSGRRSRGDRARTLACALPRLLPLEPALLWSLIEPWLSQDLSRSQLLTDLLTLGPMTQHLAGPDAAADLARWAESLSA